MEEPSNQQANSGLSDNLVRSSAGDLTSASYVIGGSLIVGAIILAAGFIYGVKAPLEKFFANQTAITQQTAQVPSAPTQPTVVPTQPTAPATPGTPVNIKLAANVPYLGSGNAKVTIVEYADYQCPFCEQWYKTVYPDLKSKYIDTGKIKFVYQDFAFLGPDSNTASEAAHCAADQNKFWQYHDYLFSNQQTENTGWATADHQKQFAQAVGLNAAQFNSCLDSHKYATEVQNETNAGKSYGVSGTPSVFVNGVIIVGAQPATAFEQAIDAALKK